VRWIIHVDMDAFYASVEQRDHPEYRGKPVIVGGLSRRGVVSTASYEARKYGIHSAMPMAEARQRCPQAIFLQPDHRKYAQVSSEIRSILERYSPLIEPLSLDEAFLDVTGMELLFASPTDIAREIKQRIREEVGLTASAGVAPNKFLAKLASDLKKPDGLVVVEHGQEALFVKDLPVKRLWGVGKVTAGMLQNRGIERIGQIATMDLAALVAIFGQHAETARALALGQDERKVEPWENAKSIGSEETFEKDLTDKEEMRTILLELAEQVGGRLRREGQAARTITLKIRFASFLTLTRRRTLNEPTQLDETIYRNAAEMLEKEKLNEGIRLLGVTLSGLDEARQPEIRLFDDGEAKGRALAAAADTIRAKFGHRMVVHGRLANKAKKGEVDDD
jgi:DNA polymerase-4